MNGTAYFNLWNEGEFVGRTVNLETAMQFLDRSMIHSVELVHSGDVEQCIESLTCNCDAILARANYKDVARRGTEKYRPDNMLRACKVAIRPDIHIVDYNTGRVVTDAATARYVRAAAWYEFVQFFERNDFHNLYR